MSKKCLIIDDVDVSRYVINEILSTFDYDCKEVGDHKEAMAALKSERFDLIILDWHLRRIESPAMIEEIRKIPTAISTTIIISTGVETDKNINDATAAGAQGFLSKPISPESVKAELKRLSLI